MCLLAFSNYIAAINCDSQQPTCIWGLIGPRRNFGDLGYYYAINWFFLAGVIAPVLVWLATKAFPNKPWIGLEYVRQPTCHLLLLLTSPVGFFVDLPLVLILLLIDTIAGGGVAITM